LSDFSNYSISILILFSKLAADSKNGKICEIFQTLAESHAPCAVSELWTM